MPKIALERELKKRKMSKRQFARRLEKDYKNVFRYFKTDYDPKFSTLVEFAKALNCKVKELIDE